MLKTTSTQLINKGGALPTQTPVQDSRCFKSFISCPLARGESSHSKLQCISTDVANHFSPTINKRGVLPTQTPVHNSRCCKLLLSSPLIRGGRTHLNSSAWLQMFQTTSHLTISKGGVLLTQTPVHDFICCKPLFSSPLAIWESYTPKLKIMTPDVANNFYSAS